MEPRVNFNSSVKTYFYLSLSTVY